jgi:DNA-binding NarL/FixJ family response regulator
MIFVAAFAASEQQSVFRMKTARSNDPLRGKKDILINVLLAEDHNIVRDGIRYLLETESSIKVVDEASNGAEVMTKVEAGSDADIILTEINMPGMTGLDLARHIANLYPGKKVIILSMIDNEKYVTEAFDAGACGYLLKNVSKDELVFAIRHVVSGGKYLCSELAMKMLSRVAQGNMLPDEGQKPEVRLSRRETEVLLLIAEGYTNNEIANKLFTSRRTIEGHRKNLIEKTGARNTASLIKFAVGHGLLK